MTTTDPQNPPDDSAEAPDCGRCAVADGSAPSSFLKEDDIRLAKEWAGNLCIPWKTGDGWRSVACRLAHEVERLKRCEAASVQMRDYLVEQIIPFSESGEPVDGMLKYALENTQWWDWLPSEPNHTIGHTEK